MTGTAQLVIAIYVLIGLLLSTGYRLDGKPDAVSIILLLAVVAMWPLFLFGSAVGFLIGERPVDCD